MAIGVLPIAAMILALIIAWLKWLGAAGYASASAADALEAATRGAVRMLSYQPGTVETNVAEAETLLTGQFRNEYGKLAREAVVPRAQQMQISSVAAVSAAAPVSASADRAVVLLFVNQITVASTGEPKEVNSSVRVELDKVGGRWLISAFNPA